MYIKFPLVLECPKTTVSGGEPFNRQLFLKNQYFLQFQTPCSPTLT